MSIARWLTKATRAHSECVLFIYFQLQPWLHERTSILRYAYIACLVFFNTIRSILTFYNRSFPFSDSDFRFVYISLFSDTYYLVRPLFLARSGKIEI
jgi:hypothetical protein